MLRFHRVVLFVVRYLQPPADITFLTVIVHSAKQGGV